MAIIHKIYGGFWIGLLVLLGACSEQDKFSITGDIAHPGELKKVLLYEGEQVIDSAFLDKDNQFVFNGTAVEARFYTLGVGNEYYYVIAQNGDKIHFVVDLDGNPREYTVKGSELSEKLKTFAGIQDAYMEDAIAISQQFDTEVAERPDQEDQIRAELLGKYEAIIAKGSERVLDFAKENQDNLAGFFAMISLDPSAYEQEMIVYADYIRDKFPSNNAVQAFVNHMAELKPLSVGAKAPDFEANDVDGKAVKLSDFQGKYTLLDFWASWCGPCRQENPNIVKQYNTYKDKGFTVLGVSLDNSREDWLQGIADDGLTWTHVSDLQRWNSQAAQLYKVSAIPASFLIDPDGVIVAKNLRGPALGAFLKEHLGE